MPREKHWPKTGPLPFLVDGTDEGDIKVSDTCGLYVKQKIIIKSDTNERVDLEIKRVLSNKLIKVGRVGYKIDDFVDLTAFTVVDSATVRADEQSMNRVPPEDIIQGKWAREPINADRVHQVDCYGNPYTFKNPLPVIEGGKSENEFIKNSILEAADRVACFTWVEIECVRRVSKIEYTSAEVNAACEQAYKVVKDFTYLVASPFTLDKIIYTLVEV